MDKSKTKKNKIDIYNQIVKNHDYLLFCRYSDLTSRQLIEYRTILKKEGISLKHIKNTLNLYKTEKCINQGSTLIIYFNTFLQLEKLDKILDKTKNIQFSYLINNKKIYTNYKTKLLLGNGLLTNQLIFNFFNFYLVMLQIN